MKTPNEFCGSYKVRRAAHGESVIRVPPQVTGEFAVYVNADASVVVLRKQLPLKEEKFLRDVEKWEKGESVEWPVRK